MARVLHGDKLFAAAMTYGGVQNSMREYVDAEIARAQQLVGGVGQMMFQKAESLRHDFLTSSAFRVAEAAMRQVQSFWGQNIIQPLPELWRVQNAPIVMQPYLMAHVATRKLYHAQRCDGYSGTYVDSEPGRVGEDHNDYCVLMDGMMQTRQHDDGEYDVFVTYATDVEDSAVALSFDSKVDILNAHTLMDQAIADGVDPTSRWNDNLN